MPRETLPTTEQLKYMDDLSAAALYRAEVQRIPYLSREEQVDHVTAATTGDTDAAHALVLNCLNWVWRLAYTIHREREPQHTDALDLVGTANVRMLEAVPRALQAADPIPYLMIVASNAMRAHVIYRDPLVTRQRSQTLSREHPTTVRLEDWDLPQAPVAAVRQNHPIVREALEQLSSRHRVVLEAAYSLDGGQPMKHEDIAGSPALFVKALAYPRCQSCEIGFAPCSHFLTGALWLKLSRKVILLANLHGDSSFERISLVNISVK